MSSKKRKLSVYLASAYNEFEQPDSERLRVLYSGFSKLHLLNKYAYDTNIKYWKTVILDCNQQGYLGANDNALGLDKTSLAEQFEWPGLGQPLSLNCVIDAMEKQGELMTFENFDKQYTATSAWFGWFPSLFQWPWRSTSPPLEYVVMPTIKAVAKRIMERHFEGPIKHTSDACMTLNDFKEKYARHFINQLEMTEMDVLWLLKYLQSQHGVAIADNVKGYATTYMLIKFPQKSMHVATITKHDEAVLSIRTTSRALSVQVDELEKKSEELEQQSRQEKSKGRIPKALYCLKKKKTLQGILQKRLHSLETMDTILMKMEASQDDKQVVEAFNLGADALRNLLGGEGLSLESVDDAMQNIQNALRDQKEVEDAIKIGNEDIASLSGCSDTDLEQELSDLMEEDAKPPSSTQPAIAQPITTQPITTQPTVTQPQPQHLSQPSPANSELARLNQMFSNIRSIPTDIQSRTERAKELA